MLTTIAGIKGIYILEISEMPNLVQIFEPETTELKVAWSVPKACL